jgi:hypothetical protein
MKRSAIPTSPRQTSIIYTNIPALSYRSASTYHGTRPTSLKYSCSRAVRAVIRRLGSSISIFCSSPQQDHCSGPAEAELCTHYSYSHIDSAYFQVIVSLASPTADQRFSVNQQHSNDIVWCNSATGLHTDVTLSNKNKQGSKNYQIEPAKKELHDKLTTGYIYWPPIDRCPMAPDLAPPIPHSAKRTRLQLNGLKTGQRIQSKIYGRAFTLHPRHSHCSATHCRGNIESVGLQHTLAGHLGKADLKSGREVTPGHVSSVGVPSNLQVSRRKWKSNEHSTLHKHWKQSRLEIAVAASIKICI